MSLRHRNRPETSVNDTVDKVSTKDTSHPSIYESTKYLINNSKHAPSSELKKGSNSLFSTVSYYIAHCILLSIFFVISIYRNAQYIYRRLTIKFFTLAYNPNSSPQIIRDDIKKLSKIPRRVSAILNLRDDDDENGGVDGLIFDISELTAWTVCSGIPTLAIYEYNGIINDNVLELRRYINKNLTTYFGTENAPRFVIKIPHSNKLVFSSDEDDSRDIKLEIILLLRVDGKPTIVELTRTMADLAANNELNVEDISSELIDEELTELVGKEPDILISFAPALDLQDYPPWHIRLSEIYWEPDNNGVTYAIFFRALQKYSLSKANVGK